MQPNNRTQRPWPAITFCTLLLLSGGITIAVWTPVFTSTEVLAGPHAYFLPVAPAVQ